VYTKAIKLFFSKKNSISMNDAVAGNRETALVAHADAMMMPRLPRPARTRRRKRTGGKEKQHRGHNDLLHGNPPEPF
jgi:hypothetical protein